MLSEKDCKSLLEKASSEKMDTIPQEVIELVNFLDGFAILEAENIFAKLEKFSESQRSSELSDNH
jgi:hypothetical protein